MNILLPVFRGASFDDAVRLAIDTAKAHAGRVRILSVVDAAEIHRIEAGARPGAIHLAMHAADEVRKRMTAEGTAAVAGVLRRCEEAGVPAQGEVVEGDLERELVAAAGANDLLVSAMASHFDPDLEDGSGLLVLTVMREGGIPVLLSGAPYRPARTIVAGCGGGTRTERAVERTSSRRTPSAVGAPVGAGTTRTDDGSLTGGSAGAAGAAGLSSRRAASAGSSWPAATCSSRERISGVVMPEVKCFLIRLSRLSCHLARKGSHLRMSTAPNRP